MNIRKFFNRLTLAAVAVLWAGCNDKDDGVSPNQSVLTEDSENLSSSVDVIAPESSSATEELLPESSSSEEQPVDPAAACKNTEEYPYAVDGSEVRCKADSLGYSCCDGSSLKGANVKNAYCGLTFYDYGADNKSVRAINDTLFTEQGVDDRDERLKEQYRLDAKEHEASVIDSLNKAASYCEGHDGIKSRRVFKESDYSVSKSECSRLAKDPAKKRLAEVQKDTSLLQTVKECLFAVENDLYPPEVLYGVSYTPVDQCSGYISSSVYPTMYYTTGPTGVLHCNDGTSEETPELTAAKKSYEEKKTACEQNSSLWIADIDKCLEQKDDSEESN